MSTSFGAVLKWGQHCMNPLLGLRRMGTVEDASLPSHDISNYNGWRKLRFLVDLSVSMKEEIHLRYTDESSGCIYALDCLSVSIRPIWYERLRKIKCTMDFASMSRWLFIASIDKFPSSAFRVSIILLLWKGQTKESKDRRKHMSKQTMGKVPEVSIRVLPGSWYVCKSHETRAVQLSPGVFISKDVLEASWGWVLASDSKCGHWCLALDIEPTYKDDPVSKLLSASHLKAQWWYASCWWSLFLLTEHIDEECSIIGDFQHRSEFVTSAGTCLLWHSRLRIREGSILYSIWLRWG